jgi:splicing factor 3B subunit 3
MHLYHLTVQPPTLITHMLTGSFTGIPKQQEIVLIRGDRFIETVRVRDGILEQIKVSVDDNLGISANNANSFSSNNNNNNVGFSPAAVQPLFGTVRSIALLKAPGESHRDYLVIGSDSGATVILALRAGGINGVWNWERVAGMNFGRSGSRRAIPGQMIAVDPRGRALLTAALESKKFAHTISRLTSDNNSSDTTSTTTLTLSSPLESHRPGHLCQVLVALDAGIEHHPAFATIEFDFGNLDARQIQTPKTPLDLKEVQASSQAKQLCYYELDQGLNSVVRKWSEPIPFAAQTVIPVPGGNDGPGGVLLFSPGFIYHHKPRAGNASTAATPRIKLPTSHANSLLTAWALVKTKSVFFFFLQFEGGDLFKLKFTDSSFTLKYFDSLPVAVSMTVLRSGFLFLAAQNGPSHKLYKITGLGDDDENQPEFSSFTDNENENGLDQEIVKHSELVNLVESDALPHFGPVTGGNISNLASEDSPQFYLTHKESNSSASVSITRWGTALQESLSLEFPDVQNIKNIWSTATGHLLLSLEDSTILLKANPEEGTVVQVQQGQEETEGSSEFFASSLRLDVCTIAAGHLEGFALIDSSSSSSSSSSSAPFLQVHPLGLQLLMSPDSELREWTPGEGKLIRSAAFNKRQIVLCLESLEMVRLTFDPHTGGALNEEESPSGESSSFPVAIDHVAVSPLMPGRKTSRWIVIASGEDCAIRVLDSETLEITAIQALTAPCSGLRLSLEESTLILHCGLIGGILIRFVVDESTGQLKNPSSRFVGGENVKISECFEDSSLLVLGNRPWWISRDHLNRPLTSPLFFDTIHVACPFPLIPGAFVALGVDNSLRILSVQPGNAAGPFYRHVINLPGPGVPRRIVREEGIFAIAQPDRIVLFDPFSGTAATAIEYHGPEVALLCCFVRFFDAPDRLFLAVAGARDFCVTPRSASESFIDLFPIINSTENNIQIGQRVHRTPTETPVTALQAFNGRLLGGVGGDLRMYECGRGRLLRKSQCKLPTPAVSIKTQGLRIYVATARDSHTLVLYRPDSNSLIPIADDPLPRGITADTLVDYDTLAGSDRFGNFFINRLPAAVSEALEQDRFLAGGGDAREFLLAAPEKFERLAEFHIGDVVSVLERMAWDEASGNPGRDAIWYVSISGAIGCFLPLPTKSLASFVETIEKALQETSFDSSALNKSASPRLDLLMRSHTAFRSAFSPVKAVVDGDLVERFLALPLDLQHALAASIDRPLPEIVSKIDDLRRLIGI